MKLLSYGLDHRMEPRLAFLLRGQAVDVMRASLWMKDERGAMDFLNLASSMRLALEDWERSFALLKDLESAFLNIDFEGLSIFGRPVSLPESDIAWFAPIPDPPSLRCFQACGPKASKNFTFSNTETLLGQGQALPHAGLQPSGELAAIIGGKKGEDHITIAGFCIANNWFDPGHLDNPGLSGGQATSLGPCLVTADELEPHRLGSGFSLDLQLRVNGERQAEGRFNEMQLSFELLLKVALPTRVKAGDVFCSGPPSIHGKGLAVASGDRVELEIQTLGTLVTLVE